MSGHPRASHQISPTKLSDSVRSQCLFTTLTRAPAHFPEFNFEPRGFLEDRNQFGLAGGRGIGIGKALQVRPRFRLSSCFCVLGKRTLGSVWEAGSRCRRFYDRGAI